MKKLIEYLISSIVDNPGQVKITESLVGPQSDLIQLTAEVSTSDMGKVIGKRGIIIKSLRNLLHVKAINIGKRVILVLKED